MTPVLRARRLLTEEGWLDDHQLRIADGVIAEIEPIPVGVTERDAELLCPAYIDTHVHGGAGVDVMDDAPDVLDKLAMHKAREGVGSWLPTTVTAPLNTIHAALERIAQRCQRGGPGAQILGSYLEGPYFTPQNKGAHPPELFRELEIAELDQLIAVSQHTLRVVALAPEKEGALQAIRHLKQQNVRVMLGHSAATWQQTRAAFDAGADGLVHCYNGMTGLHHREPGMVGAGLTDKRAWLELIADGHHLHPAAMSLCERENRAHHRRDAGSRDAGWSLYVMWRRSADARWRCPYRVRWAGGQYAVCRCGSAQHGRVDGRNACGSHPYGVAASGAYAGC